MTEDTSPLLAACTQHMHMHTHMPPPSLSHTHTLKDTEAGSKPGTDKERKALPEEGAAWTGSPRRLDS